MDQQSEVDDYAPPVLKANKLKEMNSRKFENTRVDRQASIKKQNQQILNVLYDSTHNLLND